MDVAIKFIFKKHNQFFLIAIIAFLIYGETTSYDYVMDDAIVTHQNSYVKQGVSGLGDIFTSPYLKGFNGEVDQTYRPVVLATFALEYEILGLSSETSHFVNIILYVLLCFLILLFLNQLPASHNTLIPFAVALLFLVHPIHTEVVANVKSRDEILCAIGGFMSLYYALKFTKSPTNHKYLVCMILGMVIALLSKETGLAYLFLLPFTVWFFKGTTLKFPKELVFIPLALVVLFFVIRNMLLETNAQLNDLSVLNNALIGIDSKLNQITTALYIQTKGLFLQIFPAELSWDYSYNQIPAVTFLSIQGIFSWFITIAVVSFAIVGVWRKAIWGWAIVFYLATVILTSNVLVLFGATMGERFFFSPSFAFIFLFVSVVLQLFKRIKTIPIKMMQLLAVGVIAILAFKSYAQKAIWENTSTIAKAGIKSAPNSTRTWETFATYNRQLAEGAKTKEAFTTSINQAIAGYKKSTSILQQNFSAWYNLGVCYETILQPDSALYAYENSVSANPKYENAYNNIAVIHINNKELPKAKLAIAALLKLNPTHVSGLINKGLVCYLEGDKMKAEELYNQVLQLDPQNKIAIKNLSILKSESN